MIPRLFLLISIFSLPIFAENSNASFKVQSGDTLWSISRQLDIPVKELIELNSFRVFSSGAPNIQIGQLIKTQRTSDDDVRDYCYSEPTFNGVNFSTTLSKREIIVSCTKTLRKSLDLYVIGDLDSWHMNEEEANAANEKIGLQLSWNGSKNVQPDDKFWKIYFSDIRYSYYFYSLSFSESHRETAEEVLLKAAFRGDSIAADHIIKFGNYFFNKYPGKYENSRKFIESVINSLDQPTRAYWKVAQFSHWYIEEALAANTDLASMDEDFRYELDYKLLSHPHQASYLFDKATESYKSGDLDYYRWRNESIKFIQNSSSKLLTWSELGLMINLMYQSINLGEHETAVKISSVMEARLEINSEQSTREYEIYNRFIKNLYFEEEYWRGFNLVLTWILNLTSALDDLFPETYEDFFERRSYLLEFVKEAHEKEYYTDSSLADWNSDTAAKLLLKVDKCEIAENFYELAFNYYQEEFDGITKINSELIELGSTDSSLTNQIFNTDPFEERIELARCFIKEENFSKANLYLSQASSNLENYAYDKTFYKSWIDIISAKLAMSQDDPNSAFTILKEGSNNLFKNEIKLSSTLNKDNIAKFLNDYIDIVIFLEAKNFNTQDLKNFAELEAFKNRLLSNRRLEKLKIDNNKANIQSLKSDLRSNKAEIYKYEELLETNFDEKYLTKIDRLFKNRKKIISKMLGKNKEIDALFNPSYANYQKIASSLDDQSIMLSYNLAEDSGKLIAQTASKTFFFHIEDGSSVIQANISSLRSSMDLGSAFNFEAAHNLYEILFKSIEPLLSDVKNIYLYGSDLENLPFGVLLSNYSELEDISSDYEKLLQSHWLIESYSFARIFPLSNNRLNSEYDHKFLGLANPDSFKILGLPSLPNAEEEIRQIALASKSYSQNSLLTNSNASKKNLRAKLSESYERVVFSTHSLPPNWNGITSESSLVLSDEMGDYLLTATEIVNMDFRSDMIVLSSCNTEIKGSDSLYKAFLVAGTNSVMYSNWELETISASKITDTVFKSMLFDDAPKHIALQNASIQLMNDYSNRDYAHPGFWGNFSIAYRNL